MPHFQTKHKGTCPHARLWLFPFRSSHRAQEKVNHYDVERLALSSQYQTAVSNTTASKETIYKRRERAGMLHLISESKAALSIPGSNASFRCVPHMACDRTNI